VARLGAAELERLKRGVDLVALVEASGVALRRHGADLIGLCPFHDDHSPSLVVTPAKGLWHCLGACAAGGSAIDWVMRRDRVSFRHAVERLRQDASADAPTPAAPRLPPLPADADGRALLREVVTFYHETLKRSPEAVAYLEKRGLNSVDAIDHFQLGYANRTLGYRMPAKALKAGAALRGQLQRLGVLRPSGHELLSGSLVVPVVDETGEVLGLYGRKIRDDLREGTPLHLYLPGPHRGVWNEAGLGEEVILCEALLDALTFWCAGFRNVTASYGVNGFTADHREVFRRRGVKRVLIAYDRDVAGESAAAALADHLQSDGLECYRILFPSGLDANAYALRARPAAETLAERIRSAVWLGRGPSGIVAGQSNSELSREAAGQIEMPGEGISLAASPVPAAPRTPGLPVEVREHEVLITAGPRSYRVRGLERNLASDALKVNLLVRQGSELHVDTVDLYAARQRVSFVKQAATELGADEDVLKKELGRVLLELEALRDEQIAVAHAPPRTAPELTEAERAEALALLRAPDLLERVLTDFERAGVVGEETNKLVGYLAAVSRKLERPLAVVVQSSSAAGKTSLVDAVLSFVPEEEREEYSAMTGQSLFYMEGKNLRHKVLSVVEEEGAERAGYALKLLQSEGCLTIASTGKDPHTGRLVTHEYRVEGPVAIFLTTTATDLDEELLNRCLVLAVDEDRAQTRAIHRRQRERRTLEGLLARQERSDVLQLHRNAQRLLRPLPVVNPYAPRLTFLDTQTRTRRDHEKYLTLIDAVALLHQHQRELRRVERGGRTTEYIEVVPQDIATTNRLAGAVLGRSLDELPPQTRRFLEALGAWAEAEALRRESRPEDFRFSAREARRALGTGATQTKVHLARLVDLEYVAMHRGPGRTVYELLYRGEGADGRPFLPGLLDVEVLENDPERSGRESERPESGRPPDGRRSGEGRMAQIPDNSLSFSRLALQTNQGPDTHRKAEAAPSHATNGRSPSRNGTATVAGGRR